MNIADIKKELSGDEKVLESAFKLETLYKKHKLKLWVVVAALVLYFGGRTVQESIHASKLTDANEAFLLLQENPKDKTALQTLKENNPALMALFSYAQAVENNDTQALEALSKNENSIIADASRYTAGVMSKKPVDSTLYKELALFEEGYLAITAGDTKTAKSKLELIDERSALAKITGFLKHSLIKAD